MDINYNLSLTSIVSVMESIPVKAMTKVLTNIKIKVGKGECGA
jgi:hypothetical protein